MLVLWDANLICINLDYCTIKQFRVLHHTNIIMNFSSLQILTFEEPGHIPWKGAQYLKASQVSFDKNYSKVAQCQTLSVHPSLHCFLHQYWYMLL